MTGMRVHELVAERLYLEVGVYDFRGRAVK